MTLGRREFAVLEVVQGLLKRGHEVLLSVQPHGPLQKLATERGLPCKAVSMSKLLYPLAVHALWKLIDRHGIQVVHTHGSRDRWMAAIAANLCASRPIVVCGRHHCGAIRQTLMNRLLYRRLNHAIVTTGGDGLRQELTQEDGWNHVHIASIPTGVDLERFNALLDGTPLRTALGFEGQTFVVGTVCFLRNYKGLHEFIEASGIVLKRAPAVRFIIAGEGPERDSLSEHIQQAGLSEQIVMLGHRDDVPLVMAAIDLLAVPSTGTETLTQVIPQAFAMETPVVASRVGGIPDIVIHHKTGLLVPPKHPHALAEAILWHIENRERARELAQAGCRLVVERYSSQATLHRTERLYRYLLETARST